MNTIVVSALILSFSVYIVIGFAIGRNQKKLGDFLPIQTGMNAHIKTSFEYSTSQTVSTLSVATFIVTFFESSYEFGFWMIWSVITVAIGFFFIRWMSPRIRQKLVDYNHLPTLHEFLGQSYNSPTLSVVSSSATLLGFLAAYALELTVCSRLISPLLGDASLILIIALLCSVGLIYTVASGYRGVVLTDMVMMGSLWLFLVGLSVYYLHHFVTQHDFLDNVTSIYNRTTDSHLMNGATLLTLLPALFIINTFAYMADQSMFQRIVSADQSIISKKGISRSIIGSSIANIILVFLACFVFAFVPVVDNENPIVTLLKLMGTEGSSLGNVILFVAVFGLVGASLGPASTLLISCANTLYSDIIAKISRKQIAEQAQSTMDLRLLRYIIIALAILTIVIVELFWQLKFSVMDMVFAIFSSQLGMCFPLYLALTLDKAKLHALSRYATWAVVTGFVVGWSMAVIGKMTDAFDPRSASAILSLFSSFGVLSIGLLAKKT